MHSLSNSQISIQVNPKGAELNSIFNKETRLEYLWEAGAAWPKKSPVLFPIVGGLKNNTYTFKEHQYQLSRHGFARDQQFELISQTANAITLLLKSNKATLQLYPFAFNFMVRYTLHGNMLEVSFIIQNNSNEVMYASVGAHPAFKVPLVTGTAYEDYYLQFSKTENTQRWPLTTEGLIKKEPEHYLINTDILPLKKELFTSDAIVFKNLQSTSISLLSNKTPHGLKMRFGGFPYMGLWAAPQADFVCIEPWCGIADSEDSNGQLINKEGINVLQSDDVFERSYSIEVF